MAAVGTPFNGMLYRMDFHQPSDSFYQSANLQSAIDNQFLSADMNNDSTVNPASMGSSVNLDNTYFNKYSLCNPSPSLTGGSLTFTQNAVLSLNSGGVLGYSATCSGFPLSTRSKHKRKEDIFECPLKKRRISEHSEVPVFPEATASHSSADILKGEISRSCWDSNCKPERTTVIQYTESDLPVMHLAQTEEMEEASSEPFSPLCGNDSRLSGNNEELETNKKPDCLPSLIMSDVLKEGLKLKGFEEALTKKIVDSMNRPSMELVLWKPQSELLFDRLQAVPKSHKKENHSEKPAHSPSETSFIQEIEIIEDDHLCSSNTTSDPNRIWSRDEEEEMEL